MAAPVCNSILRTVREAFATPTERRLLTLGFLIASVIAGMRIASSFSLVTGAVVGGLAFWAVCSEKRMKYALFALAVYTPFEEFLLKWVPVDLYFYARFGNYGFILACFAVIWLRRLVEGRPLWVRTPIDIPLLLFLLWSGVSMLMNGIPPTAALLSYQPLLRFILLAFYLVQYIEFDERDTKRLLCIMVAVVIVEGLVGVAQSTIGAAASEFLAPRGREFMGHLAGAATQMIQSGRFNIFGTMNRYNTMGAFMALYLVVSLAFRRSKGLARYALAASYAVAVPCVILAAARAPWLGLLAGAWFVFAFEGKVESLVLPLVVLLFVVVVLSAFGGLVAYYGLDEASSLQRFLEPFSAEYRTAMSNKYGRIYYMTGFPLDVAALGAKPFLFGFGPGSLGSRATDIFGIYALQPIGVRDDWHHFVADVNWAYIFGQAGAIGLGLIVWGFVTLFSRAVRIYRHTESAFLKHLSVGYLGMFVAAVTIAFFFPMWEVRPLSLYFWLFGGIVLKLADAEHNPAKKVSNQLQPADSGPATTGTRNRPDRH